MPISSPAVLITASITFLQCVMPMIFTCSNTIFIPINSSFSFSLYVYFRLFYFLSRTLSSNACLTLRSLSLIILVKSASSFITLGSSFTLPAYNTNSFKTYVCCSIIQHLYLHHYFLHPYLRCLFFLLLLFLHLLTIILT